MGTRPPRQLCEWAQLSGAWFPPVRMHPRWPPRPPQPDPVASCGTLRGDADCKVCKNWLKRPPRQLLLGPGACVPLLPGEGSRPGRARPTPGRCGGAVGPRHSMQREACRRVGAPRGAGSELRLVAGLRVAGSQPVAAAALLALGAARHVRQGVGADEVPAGVRRVLDAVLRPGRGGGPWGPLVGGRGTHTMSLGSSLVSGGGLMRT